MWFLFCNPPEIYLNLGQSLNGRGKGRGLAPALGGIQQPYGGAMPHDHNSFHLTRCFGGNFGSGCNILTRGPVDMPRDPGLHLPGRGVFKCARLQLKPRLAPTITI
jgi:hypothetical protein